MHSGHIKCESMLDIQSLMAENRRGKKRKKEKKEETRPHTHSDTYNHFTALFQDHPGEPVPEENLWSL